MRQLIFVWILLLAYIADTTASNLTKNATCMAHNFCIKQGHLPLFSTDSIPFDTLSGIIYIHYIRKDEWTYLLNDVLFLDDKTSLSFQIADLATQSNFVTFVSFCDTIFDIINFKNSRSLYDSKYFRSELKQDYHCGGDMYFKTNFDTMVICYRITYLGKFIGNFACSIDDLAGRVRYHFPFFISIDLINAKSISRKDRRKLRLSKYKKDSFGISCNSDLW